MIVLCVVLRCCLGSVCPPRRAILDGRIPRAPRPEKENAHVLSVQETLEMRRESLAKESTQDLAAFCFLLCVDIVPWRDLPRGILPVEVDISITGGQMFLSCFIIAHAEIAYRGRVSVAKSAGLNSRSRLTLLLDPLRQTTE